MAIGLLGPDPLEQQVRYALSRWEQGESPDRIETAQVDFKEEPGRRGPGGKVLAGNRENEVAAGYLAGEMACLSNTPGGGAVILGVADDGLAIGTHLDPEWLRHRIYQLTDRMLTVVVKVLRTDQTRLLVVTAPPAIEPIRYQGKIRWRVDDNCVEVDPATWHDRQMRLRKFDWSVLPSGHTLGDVSPAALEAARSYLREGERADATDLARASDEDLVRRLGLVDGQGRLTNAGSLLLVETPDIGIDYIRREVPGGDSINRYGGTGPLLIQIARVEQLCQAANRTEHVASGFSHRQVLYLPSRAAREAIVNGVAHRDWHAHQPTTVEHVGNQLSVTSPGGFIGGVTPENIITHPPEPRNRSLAEAMAMLHLAESEGIGVDRMTADMLVIGRPPPAFSEIEGPYVRVTLFGGEPDSAMVGFVDAIEPQPSRSDVDLLLIVEHMIRHGWADANTVATTLQRSPAESVFALSNAMATTSSGHPIIALVEGVPADQPPAYRLSENSRKALSQRLVHLDTSDSREALILDWAQKRGRISSTEAADLIRLSKPYVGKLLTELARDGHLTQSRKQRKGRGFHYLPTSFAEETKEPSRPA